MKIVVDHRATQSGVWECLATLPDVELKWGNLPTGDYIVDSKAIFERKTACDFAASLIDQRLFSQAKRCLTSLCAQRSLLKGPPMARTRSVSAGKLYKAL